MFVVREGYYLPVSAEQYKQRLFAILYLAARYYAAFVLLLYGFAKLTGARFTVLDSQLAKPIGDVSGFWLTWYYFGYSAVYASLVAWVQIFGALLLCFRRTALLGALLLMPVLVNIISIDIWIIHFRFSSGALLHALYVFAALSVVLALHASDLYKFLTKRREDLLLFRNSRWTAILPAVVVLGMAGYQWHEAYWIANVNNRAPTSVDGAWHIVDVRPANAAVPEWLYFEYNRAHMAVFQFADGRTATHDFRVNDGLHTISISQTWLIPGADILNGTWARNGDSMKISGTWNKAEVVQFTLERKQVQVKDHQ